MPIWVLVRSMGGYSSAAGPLRNSWAGRPRSPAVLRPVGERNPGVPVALRWKFRGSRVVPQATSYTRRSSATVSLLAAGHHGRMTDDAGVIGWIREIVLDTPDPHRLAGFWAALLGGTPVEWYPGWVTLEPPPHGQRLSFQGTGSGAPAGAGAGVHFDVLVSDLDDAQQRVVALGGSYVERHVSPRPGADGEQISWRVCRDPDGHPFCLVTR